MTDLTPRERTWQALNHQEPDKVPLDLNGTCCTALTLEAYKKLRNYLDLAPDEVPDISSRVMMSIRSLPDLLLHYEIDTRTIYFKPPYKSKEREMPDGSFYDAYGIRWQPASYYYDAVERPLALASIQDLTHAAWPDPIDPGLVKGLRDEVRQLYETTPYCLVADIPAFGPLEGCCLTRGYEQFFVDLYTDQAFAEALLDKCTETLIESLAVLLDEVGDFIQVVSIGDDVAMQNGPFMNMSMYRHYVKPRHKKVFDFIHAHTKAKIFYHSCGSVYDLIPDFIEEGIDILNPIQTSAAKMDLVRLKREFGKELCFWGGGIDIQTQLPVYSPQQIEEEVKRNLDIMAPGGGYVFFPTHNIQADVTSERIDCMFNTVLRHRDYQSF